MSMRPAAPHAWPAAAAAGLAVLFALWLYGWRVIDPHSVAWLLHGDPAQHHLGSVFFRAEPWQWPPGAITRFGEDTTSVVFTDAIPLLALLAKLLGVPAGLQYFGLWMVLCHALSAWAGVRLLRRMGLHRPLGLAAGGLFFATAPVLLLRAYGHEALMGQFLVVLALERALAPWRWLPWLALVALAVLVHPYLAAMTALLGAAAAAGAWMRGELGFAGVAGRALASAVLLWCVAWLAGYFIGKGQISADGHRFYSANMLTWFDRMDWAHFMRMDPVMQAGAREWSRWLPPLQQATGGQYEGFAYLGVGVIAALALAVLARIAAGAPAAGVPRLAWAATLVAALGMALFAFSAQPSLGARVLADIPLGATGERLVGVFRASGRFIWPLTYLVMAWALATAGRLRLGTPLLLALLLVQEVDLHRKFKEFRDRFRDGPPHIEQPLADPRWGRVLERCPRLERVSADHARAWAAPALAAAIHGARFAPAPTARLAPEVAAAREQAALRLMQGQGWRSDTVYLLVEPLPGGTPLAGLDAQLPPGMRRLQLEGHALAAAAACLE